MKCINILWGSAELKLKTPMGADAPGVPEVPRSSLALFIKLELIQYADIVELRGDHSARDQ